MIAPRSLMNHKEITIFIVENVSDFLFETNRELELKGWEKNFNDSRGIWSWVLVTAFPNGKVITYLPDLSGLG